MPVNRSLITLLGQDAARWRGPVICMAPHKYACGVNWKDYGDEDKDEEYPDVAIPYDLETTSLAVHIACLRFISKHEHTGRVYAIQAEGVGDGYNLN